MSEKRLLESLQKIARVENAKSAWRQYLNQQELYAPLVKEVAQGYLTIDSTFGEGKSLNSIPMVCQMDADSCLIPGAYFAINSGEVTVPLSVKANPEGNLKARFGFAKGGKQVIEVWAEVDATPVLIGYGYILTSKPVSQMPRYGTMSVPGSKKHGQEM